MLHINKKGGFPMSSSIKVGTEQVVELTSKRFKLISVISVLTIIIGVIFIMASPNDSGPCTFGMVLLMTGIASYFVNRFRIWWHHK